MAIKLLNLGAGLDIPLLGINPTTGEKERVYSFNDGDLYSPGIGQQMMAGIAGMWLESDPQRPTYANPAFAGGYSSDNSSAFDNFFEKVVIGGLAAITGGAALAGTGAAAGAGATVAEESTVYGVSEYTAAAGDVVTGETVTGLATVGGETGAEVTVAETGLAEPGWLDTLTMPTTQSVMNGVAIARNLFNNLKTNKSYPLAPSSGQPYHAPINFYDENPQENSADYKTVLIVAAVAAFAFLLIKLFRR